MEFTITITTTPPCGCVLLFVRVVLGVCCECCECCVLICIILLRPCYFPQASATTQHPVRYCVVLVGDEMETTSTTNTTSASTTAPIHPNYVLTRLLGTNFRCFNEFNVTLSSFTTLIGPNNSGKTIFLQAAQVFILAYRSCLDDKYVASYQYQIAI